MSSANQSLTVFFSRKKLILIYVIMTGLLLMAVLPGVGDQVNFTKFLFSPIGSVIRYLSVTIFVLILASLLPALLYSVFGIPALIIDSKEFIIRNFKRRKFNVDEIDKLLVSHNGNITILMKSGIKVELPFSIYKRGAAYDEAVSYFKAAMHY